MERLFRIPVCFRVALAVMLTFAFLVLPGQGSAQAVDLLRQTLFSPGAAPQAGAQQGFSVAVSAEFIVVGAPTDDLGGENSGAVKVYASGTGQLVHVLVNPTPAAGDNFGGAVAISGTRIIAGAPGDDATGSDVGRAYFYDLGGVDPTTPQTVLDPASPVAGARFGSAVAISGLRAVIGAPADDAGTAASGRTYVHDLAGVNPVIVLSNPSPAEGDWFGVAVGISNTRVIVGAQLDDTNATDAGSAYVFDTASAMPNVPVAVLPNPSPEAGDWFGCAVAISGSRAVVGALFDGDAGGDSGGAYLYDLDVADPALSVVPFMRDTPEAGEWFGGSVAISGTRVLVGAVLAGGAGRSYLYDLAGAGVATPLETIENPTPASFDLFGGSVAISGTSLVVGAYWDDAKGDDAGSAYLYDLGSAPPLTPLALHTPAPLPGEWFGSAVAVSGSRVVVGAPGTGAGGGGAGRVYVFDRAGATPEVPVAVIENPSPHADDRFGAAVAISGMRVVVGAFGDDTAAPDAGRAYVFDLTNANAVILTAILEKPGAAASDLFGSAVAISGSLVVVGAFGDDTGATDAGSAHVYDFGSGTPTAPQFVLRSPVPRPGDWFGSAVAISGNRVVVGAFFEDTGASAAGSVFVFDLTSQPPTTPSVILRNPSPAADDWFGYSVGVSGAVVAVGAIGDDAAGSDAGAAYLFDLSSGPSTVPVAVLHKPVAAVFDFFGAAVAVSGTRVVVGAYGDDTGGLAAGSSFVFDLASDLPAVPVATLHNPLADADDRFAFAVAIDGFSVVAGAYLDDTTAPEQGAAYVFDAAPLVPVTGIATEVDYTTARVSGLVNPGGRSTTVKFNAAQVGSPFAPASAVIAEQSPLTGVEEQAVTASLTGLQPGTTYRFHVSASNDSLPAGQAVWGHDVLFTTVVNDSPVVTLAGVNPLTIEASPNAYGDAGASATDTEDGLLTPAITANNVVPNVAGTYAVTWRAIDRFGAIGTATRTVQVVDATAPVFTNVPAGGNVLNGSAVPELAALASASDQSGGPVTITQHPPAGRLFMVPGAFTVTLTATDPSGNVATTPVAFTVLSDDSDNDGLLDSWEDLHDGTDFYAAAGDFDRDGIVELLELAFGLDPKRPDVGNVPSAVVEAGYLTITLTRRPGALYSVETASSPQNVSFSATTTTVLLDDGVTLKVRDNVLFGTPPARFLRVLVRAAP